MVTIQEDLTLSIWHTILKKKLGKRMSQSQHISFIRIPKSCQILTSWEISCTWESLLLSYAGSSSKNIAEGPSKLGWTITLTAAGCSFLSKIKIVLNLIKLRGIMIYHSLRSKNMYLKMQLHCLESLVMSFYQEKVCWVWGLVLMLPPITILSFKFSRFLKKEF